MLNSIDKKILEVERNGGKDGKALCKLMNNAVYEKTMGNLKKGVDAKLVNNGKGYLKWASKPSYMSHKIFDNHWRQFAKNKFILTLKKPTYTGMCILDYVKCTSSITIALKIKIVTTQSYYSQTLIV